MNGAAVIVNVLKQRSVEVVFGMPGLQSLALYNELAYTEIKHVLITNELYGAFMAGGYTSASGKTGVCLSIEGPGISNALSGLAEAKSGSVPLVYIVSISDKEAEQYGKIHDLKISKVFKEVVKSYIEPQHINEVRNTLQEAFHQASSSSPGPVIFAIREDLLKEDETENQVVAVKERECFFKEHDDKIKEAVRLIHESTSVGFYCGDGAFGARKEIRYLADRLGASVGTTLAGRGLISEKEEMVVGWGDGESGLKKMDCFFQQTDLLIVIGCHFTQMATLNWTVQPKGKIIYIDVMTEEREDIYKNKTVLIIAQKIEVVIAKLIQELEALNICKNDNACKRLSNNLPCLKRETASKVSPAQFFRMLNQYMKPEDVLVVDCGNNQLWSYTDYRVSLPRTFIGPLDYQSMGFSIPGAIGAKLADKNKKIISVIGDGGFLLSGLEIITAVKEGLDIPFFIFCDGKLGIIDEVQKKRYGREESVKVVLPDLKYFAQALGLNYFSIKKEDELLKMDEIIKSKETSLVEVAIDYKNISPYLKVSAKNNFFKKPLAKKVEDIVETINHHVKHRLNS